MATLITTAREMLKIRGGDKTAAQVAVLLLALTFVVALGSRLLGDTMIVRRERFPRIWYLSGRQPKYDEALKELRAYKPV